MGTGRRPSTTAESQRPGDAGAQRDAIIFIPAIGRSWGGTALDGVVDELLGALRQNQPRADHTKSPPAAVGYGGLPARVSTISTDGRPRCDVYGLDYSGSLSTQFDQASLARKCLTLLGIVLHMIGPLLSTFAPGKQAKTITEKLQIAAVVVVLLLLGLYLVILIGALIQVALQTWPGLSGDIRRIVATWGSIFTGLVVVTVAIRAVVSPKLANSVATAAGDYVALGRYLVVDDRLRRGLVGQVVALLTYVATRKGLDYARYHLVSYSFGSIIALDALFPAEEETEPIFSEVKLDTLVTIGCPFDMIRLLQPDYFRGRHALSGVPRDWLNVYAPVDILASTFTTAPADPTNGQEPRPDVGVEAITPDGSKVTVMPCTNQRFGRSKASALEWITLVGLAEHSTYWTPGPDPETNCFRGIMRRLFPPADGHA